MKRKRKGKANSKRKGSTSEKGQKPLKSAEHIEKAEKEDENRTKPWPIRLFLAEKHIPLWSVFLGLLGIIVAIVALVFTYTIPWSIQSHADERSKSKINYAFFIKPAPTTEENFEKTTRWEVSMMISNVGPATAQAFILHMHTPNPILFLHSSPKIMSSPAAAEVQIIERIPRGIYQIVFREFLPGDTCFLNMFYVTTDDKQKEFHEAWNNGGIFDGKFGKRFVQQFWFTGENLNIENFGALKMSPSFGQIE